MDQSLSDKEVICILDTRQIQRYMFRANSFIDSLGGSDIVNHILEDGIEFALKNIDPPLSEDQYDISLDPDVEKIPYFASENIQFQIISCGAGNALCIVRTGLLCQKIIRKISRYFIDRGYSLNIAAAMAAKTDNLGNDISQLYKNLNAIKASCDISDPLEPIAVVMREKKTGEPVIDFDSNNGDYISESSRLRRQEAGLRPQIIRFNDVQMMKAFDDKEYRAVIHADGNNLGITIGRILQSTPDYASGIKARRHISRNIVTNFSGIMTKTLSELETWFTERKEASDDFEHVFQVTHQAGDDINCMARPDAAIKFMELFYKNLKGKVLWNAPGLVIPLYVCFGIAFVSEEYNFHEAFSLAEECCSSAKEFAKKEKNLRNGLAGNWLDFQVSSNRNAQELDILREQTYTTDEGINLLLRPYCIDDEAEKEVFHYRYLKERAIKFKAINLKASEEKILRMAYGSGRRFFTQWIKKKEADGLDLTGKLGSPLYERQDDEPCATWFDACEISDFISSSDPEEYK